ncbi:PP2C family protein-serine/threonine phosphatase [Modestobacter sp. SSW1-42]|uniref:PP2C family protein-serine/threonine phosphatase n=1 Tax=Modestobacter sp. SSW1-42 TaxID=596372 RepID=UPI003988A095
MHVARPEDHLVVDDAARLRALCDADVVGIAAGEDDLITSANREMLRIIGRDGAAVTEGIPWPVVTPAEHAGREGDGLRQPGREGGSLVTGDLSRPDGTRVPVLVAVAPTGRDAHRWVAVVVDLGHEERSRRLLESDAAIVAALLEDAPVGFAFIDPQLRFVRVNRELAAMNGFTVAEHEGTAVFDLLPGLRQSAEPLLRRVVETGEPLRDVEITGTTPADPGVRRTWLESFFPVRLPNGSTLGVAAVARDVTEVQRLQEQLAQTLARQQEALHELQTSLLPPLPAVPGVQLAARYLAASREVHLGGDWFDAALAPDGRLALTVGDIAGHGLTAVGVMARAGGAVRAAVCEGLTPGQVLAGLNRLLVDPSSTAMATAVVAFLDLRTGVLEYAVAGHPGPLLRRADGTVQVLDLTAGLMLGVRPDVQYRTRTVQLGERDSLLLYTDGLVERRGESLDAGEARLCAVVAGGRTADRREADLPAADLVDRAVTGCLGDRVRDDDVCLLGVTRLAAEAAGRPGPPP